MLRPTRWQCVIIQKTTVCDSYPLVQTVHRAEVCSELCGISTTTTPAPEELGLCEVVAPVRGSPQRVRVTDGQVLAFEDRLHYVNDQTPARREALGAVRATAVLKHRSFVIHGQVRGFRQRHLVTVYLKTRTQLELWRGKFVRRWVMITVFWDMKSCVLLDRYVLTFWINLLPLTLNWKVWMLRIYK